MHEKGIVIKRGDILVSLSSIISTFLIQVNAIQPEKKNKRQIFAISQVPF